MNLIKEAIALGSLNESQWAALMFELYSANFKFHDQPSKKHGDRAYNCAPEIIKQFKRDVKVDPFDFAHTIYEYICISTQKDKMPYYTCKFLKKIIMLLKDSNSEFSIQDEHLRKIDKNVKKFIYPDSYIPFISEFYKACDVDKYVILDRVQQTVFTKTSKKISELIHILAQSTIEKNTLDEKSCALLALLREKVALEMALAEDYYYYDKNSTSYEWSNLLNLLNTDELEKLLLNIPILKPEIAEVFIQKLPHREREILEKFIDGYSSVSEFFQNLILQSKTLDHIDNTLKKQFVIIQILY